MTRGDPRIDPRWPDLYQRADGKWAERLPRQCPRCATSWGGGGAVLVGIHKCGCSAARDHGGGHRTQLCTVCGHEEFTPPLNEQTCRYGPIRMMAPDGGLTE